MSYPNITDKLNELETIQNDIHLNKADKTQLVNLLDKLVGGHCLNIKADFIGEQFYNASQGVNYGIQMNNSDIIGVNGVWFCDESNNVDEGLHWGYTISDTEKSFSTIRCYKGDILYTPYRLLGGGGDTYKIDYILAFGTNYIRYASGLQICWARITHPATTSTSYLGSNTSDRTYYSNVKWTFPLSFSSNPVVMSLPEDVLAGLHTAANGGISTTNCTIVHTSATSGVSYTQNIAIGRWK